MIVASFPCERWKATSAFRSTSATPSPYVIMNVSLPIQEESRRSRPPVCVARPVSTRWIVQSGGDDEWISFSPRPSRTVTSALRA